MHSDDFTIKPSGAGFSGVKISPSDRNLHFSQEELEVQQVQSIIKAGL
jgi:hypothetical protein